MELAVHLLWRPTTAGPSALYPGVPAVAWGSSFVEIRHLDPAQIILRELVARGVHVDTEDPCGIQAEDLLLHGARERCVAMPCDERLGDLKAPERLNRPLRRPVPDQVCPPQDVVGAEGLDDLSEEVGAGGGIGGDELPEGGPQFHVEVREARLLLLHLAEFRGPGHLS